MDEKWAFIGKKKNQLSEEEKKLGNLGDRWDHVAEDAESRLILSLIPGKRTDQSCIDLIKDVKERTKSRADIYFTSDEHPGYEKGIEINYGKKRRKKRKSKLKRNTHQLELWKEEEITVTPSALIQLPAELVYATVRKTRKGSRIVKVVQTLVFGAVMMLAFFLERSKASKTINTSFVERVNGTDRSQNARKRRRANFFSRKHEIHDLVGYFIGYSYNFCWTVRTLRKKKLDGSFRQNTPAMAAKLSDHIWSVAEWVTRPVKL